MRAGPFLLAALALAGCGRLDAGSPGVGGQDVAVKVPHPGVAEGRPLVTLDQRGTFYLCPEVGQDGLTPLLTDPCLIKGPDIGHTRIEGYSMLDPSVQCADGMSATDVGTLGFGFAGEPLITPGQASADAGAVLDCLSGRS